VALVKIKERKVYLDNIVYETDCNDTETQQIIRIYLENASTVTVTTRCVGPWWCTCEWTCYFDEKMRTGQCLACPVTFVLFQRLST